ncbi:MAG: hypothetical protein H7A08_04850 [Oceanospirillaceae bacterium]|nr:hypothetical protein [Oceanospirillaceae bacterium]MCP5350051.1 hypothetical protein [Oceanospirillaceae bacterium]
MAKLDTPQQALRDYFDAMFLAPVIAPDIPKAEQPVYQPADTICASQRMCSCFDPFTSLDLRVKESRAAQVFWELLGLCQTLPDGRLRRWCVSLCGMALHKAWKHGRP